MSGNPVLVDTNVLIYSRYRDSEHHEASLALLERAQNGGIALCTTPQNLAEFYSVVTNARRVTSPRSAEEALDVIELFLAMPGLSLLQPPADLVQRWVGLLRQRPVTGAAFFDVQLVATMQAAGVNQIYTFDESDFQDFDQIEVLTPQ